MQHANEAAGQERPSVHTLDNGLRIVVEERPLAPVTAVTIRYDVGSRVEVAGATGLAHLFEHLMFQGSEHVESGEHSAIIDSVGGWFNGVTAFDDTVYFDFVPNNALELALWLEADRMGGLLAAVDQRGLDNQRDVVRNERKQMLEGQPYGDALELLFARVFPPGHPYHHLPIGSMTDLQAATLQDVHAFFTEYYAPGNAVISLVGDVTEAEAVALVDRYFSPIPAGKGTREGTRHSIEQGERVLFERRAQVPTPAVYFAWPVPAHDDDELGAVQLALEVLGGRHGRLEHALTRDRSLAGGVSAHVIELLGGNSVAIVSVQAEGAASSDELEAAIAHELSRAAQGIDQDELNAARLAIQLRQMQSDNTQQGRGTTLARSVGAFGEPTAIDDRFRELSNVSPAQVSAAAERWLAGAHAGVLRYLPETDAPSPSELAAAGRQGESAAALPSDAPTHEEHEDKA